MNNAQTNGGMLHSLFTPFKIKDFAVTWAGPHPLRPGFCLGSEDSRLLFTDEQFEPVLGPGKGSVSGEAINGVAFYGEWIAASTRADVTMWRMHADKGKEDVVGRPHGAHGVVAAPSGYFVAPMGRTGIMILRAGAAPGDTMGVLTSDKEGMYFYRVIALPGKDGKDLLVCAAGQRGIALTELRWGEPTYTIRIAHFEGFDVVDVCPVASDAKSPAVAAVGRDGTLIVRDPLLDSKPSSIKFKTIQGTPYRLLSSGDDILLLTSRALYVLKKLAYRLATGVSGEFTTDILVVPMEAVDANIVHDRWLLVVTPDEVLRGDLAVLQQAKAPAGEGQVEETPQLQTTAWQWHEHSSSARELVGSVQGEA